MADGDSAFPNAEVEKRHFNETMLCDVAVEQDFNSISPSKTSEEKELNEMDSNRTTPALHAVDSGGNYDTPNNDMTKYCKDTANAIIHSIINGKSDPENQETNESNLSFSGIESKSPRANLSALSQLCVYDSDSDHSVSELSLPLSSEDVVELRNNYNYRTSQPVLSDSDEDSEDDSDDSDEYIDDSSSTTSSSSSSTAVASSDESDSDIVLPAAPKPDIIRNDEPRTKGELSISDLPPIEDLHISVPEQECMELGHIESIVGTLVVVQAKKNSPALDLDSVLFLDQGKRPLGRVFDVFGPVKEPCYCIRFNSTEHIREKEIAKGMAVYCAPRSKYSSYVFLPDLLKMKGSDASWEFNNEPPQKFLDYSDDEEERRARRADRATNKEPKEEDPDQPCHKRSNYEQIMNSRNLRMSAINPPVSSSVKQGPWGGPWGPQPGASIFTTPPPSTPPLGASSPSVLIRPPSFNVPPPNFSTLPPPAFLVTSTPPPPFPPVRRNSSEESPAIPKFDSTLPPPPVISPSPPSALTQYNFPPPVPHNPPNLPPHLFQIPPPPPLPSLLPTLPSIPSNLSCIPPSLPPPIPPSLPSPIPPPLPQMAFLSSPPPQPPPTHW
ncbi:H/ACA ribonucleoprotein complex non-core subunit NAF1 [Anabrus simplex]|uniref:H/ACA ribonucleoprotein complex non-core subunit NAF1 n=1 Tax=Anabrus simplex TaxID=316456 RepID=UPI0035A36336